MDDYKQYWGPCRFDVERSAMKMCNCRKDTSASATTYGLFLLSIYYQSYKKKPLFDQLLSLFIVHVLLPII